MWATVSYLFFTILYTTRSIIFFLFIMLLIPQIVTSSTILTTAEKCQTRPLLMPQSSAQWLIITVLLYAQFKSSCEIKAWKKFRPRQDLNPWPLWYWCSALVAIKPTGSWSHCKFWNISIEGKECKYIYERSYTCIFELRRKIWSCYFMVPHRDDDNRHASFEGSWPITLLNMY